MINAIPKHKTCRYISAGFCVCVLNRKAMGIKYRTTQNHYFVATEHGRGAAPGGRGEAGSAGVRWGATPAIYCEAANATK